MRRTRAGLAIAVFAAAAALQSARVAGQRAPAVARPEVPSFNTDVAPILQKRCVSCHRPGQPAPMPLRTYAEARPWLKAIQLAVESRRMPPWGADRRFGRFDNDPSLTDDEIRTIQRWVDGGGKEGGGPAPESRSDAATWRHPSGRPPDVVIELPAAIDVPPSTQWPTFNVYSPQPSELGGADRFVEAVQLRPGRRAVTHHSSLATRRFPAGVTLGRARAWPGGPELDGLPVLTDPAAFERAAEPMPTASEAFSSGGVAHLTYFFPGNDGFVMYPPSAGKRLPAGNYFEWSLHYTPSGRPERDRHTAGIWLHPRPPAHEVITLRVGDFHIVNGEEVVLPAGLHTNPGHAAIVDVTSRCEGRTCTAPVSMLPAIPPHESDWRITAITPVLDDVTLYSASPHGHLRLKDMTYVVTHPDGREETLLSVPRYDFNWQFVYRFQQPRRISAGSTLKAIARYDNSAANRLNPDPSMAVKWSEQSTDEMFNGFLDLTVDRLEITAAGAVPAEVPSASRLVIATGCAARDDEGHWLLVDASPPARSMVMHADRQEVDTARRTPDHNRYRLLGTAEFGPVIELLATADRPLFTTARTANATGLLVHGRSIGVKGVLIGGTQPAINLVSVWPVSGTCS